MIPTTIIDNFFESPELIRNYALSLDFSKDSGNYPGVRTDKINEVNKKLFHLVLNKVYSVFFGVNDKVKITGDITFQLINDYFENGWFHKDSTRSHIAGVVYLNPQAPLNGGTLIGQSIKECNIEDIKVRDDFYNNKNVDLEQYRQIRDNFNACFEDTLIVNNVFNRALIYDSQKFHRENKFFGKTKEDSRLTLVFFIKFIIEDSLPPMIRFNSIKE
jgi:hypothetical protein